MNRTITVPGWVWLICISVIFIVIAIMMVRNIGMKNLFVFGEQQGVNEWLRLFCFGLFVGVPITCAIATISHLTS